MLDICIRNGTLVDGSGQASAKGDIGICDGKIMSMGDLSASRSKISIDAQGQIVCPGIIDAHTHSDAVLSLDARCASQVRQGVTTQIVGLCGSSLAPLNDVAAERVKSMVWFDSPISWRSYASYLDSLEHTALGTNIGGLVGHGTLRAMVMENPHVPATFNEIAEMAAILDDALAQGAFGLSTGLEYNPGKAAQTNELESLCQVVQKHNGIHTCHTRNRDSYYLSALAEVIDITRNTGVKLQISHINPKYGRRNSTMAELFSLIHESRHMGFEVSLDIMPSEWNHTSGMALLPLWAHALAKDELATMLNSGEGRLRLRENPTPVWQLAHEDKWDRIYLFGGNATRAYVGQRIQSIADTWGCTGWDAFCRLLHMEAPNFGTMILCSNAFDLDDIRMALTDPYSSVVSDGVALAMDGPLAGRSFAPNTYNWVYTFFSNFVFGKQALSLEAAIAKLTLAPAKQMGISDRGLLAPGYKADVLVFDKDKMHSEVTLQNPAQYSAGMSTVIVNGKIAYASNEETVHSFGSVLRK